jgi:lipopolysaccharide transport system permease protein
MTQVERALTDLKDAAGLARFWASLAWHEIKVRYRGSMIGPFWLTLSTGLLIGGLGFLYSQLLNQDPAKYVPFLAVGILLWQFMTGTVQDCCTTFVAAAGTIKQIKLPLLGHIAQTIWRNLIILAHNLVILAVVAWYFELSITWGWLLAAIGFAVMLGNVAWMGVLLAIFCARFRDLTQIVASAFQLAFFLSPVLWEPSLLKSHYWLADFNPLYALIEIVRGPLLGKAVPWHLWSLALAFFAVGTALASAAFVRYRARIVYWV